MSADKVLECPRCPFATELRHHLEYHLRSHYGSRPYKCDKCTYRCYNQSMLNSHAKSHTNVYQFRCADCQFAAKYCHSLKVRHDRSRPASAERLDRRYRKCWARVPHEIRGSTPLIVIITRRWRRIVLSSQSPSSLWDRLLHLVVRS